MWINWWGVLVTTIPKSDIISVLYLNLKSFLSWLSTVLISLCSTLLHGIHIQRVHQQNSTISLLDITYIARGATFSWVQNRLGHPSVLCCYIFQGIYVPWQWLARLQGAARIPQWPKPLKNSPVCTISWHFGTGRAVPECVVCPTVFQFQCKRFKPFQRHSMSFEDISNTINNKYCHEIDNSNWTPSHSRQAGIPSQELAHSQRSKSSQHRLSSARRLCWVLDCTW
jgi:hypothetical protein